MKWNSNLYDEKHDYVAEYGKDLLQYIPENKEQRILDLGCGTGTLTAELVDLCGYVLGVDSSESMVEQAKKQYPAIDFQVCDALKMSFEQEWDVVFSNAVFHWISDHSLLLKNIHRVLKPNGLLVCEFGANGNIAGIEGAFLEALKETGHTYQPKFNFPTVEAFGELLERNGFIIDKIYDFDRPTPLKDGEQGLANWMKQFFASELAVLSEAEREKVLRQAEEQAKTNLWNGKEWVADYRRLRVIAYVK